MLRHVLGHTRVKNCEIKNTDKISYYLTEFEESESVKGHLVKIKLKKFRWNSIWKAKGVNHNQCDQKKIAKCL